jgi:hypothetical protein
MEWNKWSAHELISLREKAAELMCGVPAYTATDFMRNGSTTVALLLRGEAFRAGGQHSRQSSHDFTEQIDATASIKRYVMEPARDQGWSVYVAFDVLVDRVTVPRDVVERTVCSLRPHSLAISGKYGSAPHPIPTPQLSWLLSLAHFEKLSFWSALLAIRVDLELKAPLLLPRPVASWDTAVGVVRVPFVRECARPRMLTYLHADRPLSARQC